METKPKDTITIILNGKTYKAVRTDNMADSGPDPNTQRKNIKAKSPYEPDDYIKDRLDTEFSLYRYWYCNKGKDGIYSFDPVNIRSEKNPYYIDAIEYDTSPRSEGSLACLAVGNNDKLMFHGYRENKEEGDFIKGPCFKTEELKRILMELQSREQKNQGITYSQNMPSSPQRESTK